MTWLFLHSHCPSPCSRGETKYTTVPARAKEIFGPPKRGTKKEEALLWPYGKGVFRKALLKLRRWGLYFTWLDGSPIEGDMGDDDDDDDDEDDDNDDATGEEAGGREKIQKAVRRSLDERRAGECVCLCLCICACLRTHHFISFSFSLSLPA
jgi:hypothetical protein